MPNTDNDKADLLEHLVLTLPQYATLLEISDQTLATLTTDSSNFRYILGGGLAWLKPAPKVRRRLKNNFVMAAQTQMNGRRHLSYPNRQRLVLTRGLFPDFLRWLRKSRPIEITPKPLVKIYG